MPSISPSASCASGLLFLIQHTKKLIRGKCLTTEPPPPSPHTQTNWPQEQERRARNCFPPWHLPGTSSQRAASVSTVAVAVAAAATKGATSYELSKLLSFKEEKLRRSLDKEEIVVVLLFSFLFRFPLASFSPCLADVFLGNTSPPKFIFSPFSSSSCVCVCVAQRRRRRRRFVYFIFTREKKVSFKTCGRLRSQQLKTSWNGNFFFNEGFVALDVWPKYKHAHTDRPPHYSNHQRAFIFSFFKAQSALGWAVLIAPLLLHYIGALHHKKWRRWRGGSDGRCAVYHKATHTFLFRSLSLQSEI